MIDISIEEAMRCLQLYQEYLPEKGYVSQCFDLAISALKTIEDMQLNGDYTPAPHENVSRETLTVIANYDCLTDTTNMDCDNCKYHYKNRCISHVASSILDEDKRKELLKEWMNKQSNY